MQLLNQTYQAQGRPGVDVVLEGDCTAGALGLTHREVLVECGSSLDRGRVGASGLIDVVNTAVGSNLCWDISNEIRHTEIVADLTVPR